MARSNYALISALYSDKSRGLYSDIYFPIIKYAIVKIYGSKKEGEHYATSDNVQQKIAELFGIKIPHAVIAKTILSQMLILIISLYFLFYHCFYSYFCMY